MKKEYEMVIGVEVHVELKTESKIFCSCSTAFGAEPNTQCCPVCMGMPGVLPVLNQKVVEYAVRAGLATNCSIASFSKQDRKNYFYPDLPKAYQISQYDMPLCEHGYLEIDCGVPKRIGITRIHIEEDAGKLIHTPEGETLCDYNRCGVPLIEIVSEPDLRSAEEVSAFLRKLRAILVYTGVSDCKMQEGSMRCDVNLSVRPKGTKEMGTRTEMKNLNSFQFIAKAIGYEFARQVEAVQAGEQIVQETRRFDQQLGKTFSMRSKEDADDYRYFPEPDLVPVVVSREEVQRIRESIPELPDAKKARFLQRYKIAPADAEILVGDREVAEYFEKAAELCAYPKALSALMLGEVFRLLDGQSSVPVPAEHLAELAGYVGEGKISAGSAKRAIADLWGCREKPAEYLERMDLWQQSDEQILKPVAQKAVEACEKSVWDYRKGKKQAIGAVIGWAMKQTGGKANAAVLRRLIQEILEEPS